MTTLTATKRPLISDFSKRSAGTLRPPLASFRSRLDADTLTLLSIFGRTLYLLGLGTIGVVAITGQPPLFFLPLALFLFFVGCLRFGNSDARSPSPDLARIESGQAGGSSAFSAPLVDHDDLA
jgi:hypothetical protein